MNTLKTIQGLSRIGKILSKIIFICCIVGFCGCIAGMVSLALGAETFNREYLNCTAQAAQRCENRDLVDSMVIGTSAIVNTELDGAVGMNSGIYNNPFLIWGRYRKKLFRYYLPISFQFHHTQMDRAHAGRFLENLQREIGSI